NIFVGLLWDGRDGSAYCPVLRMETSGRGATHRVLRNFSSAEGRTACLSFPFETFERAALGALREVDPAEAIDAPEHPDETLAVAAELERVAAQVNKIKDELLAGGDVAALADVLRQLEAKQRELRQREQANRERRAVPVDDAWRQLQRFLREAGLTHLKFKPSD